MTRSPRRLKEQVRETVTDLPIHAARFAVMGVGRALLLTDRVRKDYREARESGLGPVLGRLKDDAGNITGMVVGRVAGRVSGNGQARRAEEKPARDTEISVGTPKAQARPAPPKPPSRPAAATKPATKPAATKPVTKPVTKPATTKAAAPEPKPKPAAEKPAGKPVPAKDLPVSGYDDATLASVRARLRGLDARQVAQLRDYERANAARADFLRMYENRIAKLRGQR
jgi:hypothetical protein